MSKLKNSILYSSDTASVSVGLRKTRRRSLHVTVSNLSHLNSNAAQIRVVRFVPTSTKKVMIDTSYLSCNDIFKYMTI